MNILAEKDLSEAKWKNHCILCFENLYLHLGKHRYLRNPESNKRGVVEDPWRSGGW